MADHRIVSEITSEQWQANGRQMESEALANGWITFHMSGLDLVLRVPQATTLLAIDNADGQPLGSIIGYKIRDSPIFYVGSYMVTEQNRGKGIGQALWDKLIEQVPTDAILVVDSTGEMTQKYRGRDFSHPFSYQIFRMKGPTSRIREAAASYSRPFMEAADLIPYKEENLPALLQYDAKVSGRDRSEYLKPFLSLPTYQCVLANKTGTNTVLGYGVKCPTLLKDTYRIGPLYAKNQLLAVKILEKLLNFEGEALIYSPSIGKFWEFLKNETGCEIYMTMDRSSSKYYKEKVDFDQVFSVTAHMCQPDC